MHGYVILMMHILNVHLVGWIYAASVVVEGPINMEFLYGGLGNYLHYTYQGKSHTKTPKQQTHMHIQHMHTDYTQTHIHSCTYHTYILIFTTITTGIYMHVILLAAGTPALSPQLNGPSVQLGVHVHGLARPMRDERGGVHS